MTYLEALKENLDRTRGARDQAMLAHAHALAVIRRLEIELAHASAAYYQAEQKQLKEAQK